MSMSLWVARKPTGEVAALAWLEPWKSEEAGEAILFATAVRETEELALAPSDIVARGFLSLIVTVTNFYVEPCVEALP